MNGLTTARSLVIALAATALSYACSSTDATSDNSDSGAGGGDAGGSDGALADGTTGGDGGAEGSTGDGASTSVNVLALAFNDVDGSDDKHAYAGTFGSMMVKAVTTAAGNYDEPTDVSADGKSIVLVRHPATNALGAGIIVIAKIDGSGETAVTGCNTICKGVAFGSDGNLWYSEKTVLDSRGKIRTVAPTANATAQDWGKENLGSCVIDGFSLTNDRTKMIVTVNNSAGNGGCAQNALGIYVTAFGDANLGTPFVPPVDATSGSPWYAARPVPGGNKIVFASNTKIDGGPVGDYLFSITLGGTDLVMEVDNASDDFAVTSSAILVPRTDRVVVYGLGGQGGNGPTISSVPGVASLVYVK